ncbi:MAG: LPS-assembly protein LptD [Lautropia sp.]
MSFSHRPPRLSPFRLPAPPHLALVVALLVAVADEARSDEPLRLRLDPTLDLKRSASTGAPASTYGQADRLDTRQGPEGTITELKGNAQLRRAGTSLRADSITYDEAREEARASGSIVIEQNGNRISGPGLTLKLDSGTGVIDAPSYELANGAGRGSAQKIELLGQGRFGLSNAYFTTCRPDNEDWRIEARRLDIDQEAGQGRGEGTKLVLKDTTLVKLPYFFFPVGEDRQSGFLTPTLSVTSRSGPEVSVPYYLNLAPNYDAVIAPRLSVRRGLQISTDVRYLFRPMRGEARLDWVPNDVVTGDSRYFLSSANAITDIGGWGGGWNVKRVSDDNYFVDYSRTLVDASERSLPQDLFLSRDFGQWNVLARATAYQNILEARLAPPYEKLPQLRLSTYRSDVRGFDLGLVNDLTWFSRPLAGSAEGLRMVVNPQVSYPVRGSYWFVTPKASLHATTYQLERNPFGPESLSRALPTFSLDSGIVMDRPIRWGGRETTQTLEPRLFYVYTPYREQTRIPVFDSAASDFNFAQIFTENPYTGADRIADVNQLTAALLTRYIDTSTGVERLRLALAQRFYFEQQRVTIPGLEPRTDNRSDLLLAASGDLGGGHGFDAGMQYALRSGRVPRYGAAWRYWPDYSTPGDGGQRRLLNLGVQFQSKEYAQWSTSWQWPISPRWSSLAKVNYSFLTEKTDPVTGNVVDVKPGLVEGLLGLEYAQDCYTTRFVVQRFVTAEGKFTTAFFVQLDLRGLGRVGSDPFGILVRNIPGYRVPENTPAPSRFYGYE